MFFGSIDKWKLIDWFGCQKQRLKAYLLGSLKSGLCNAPIQHFCCIPNGAHARNAYKLHKAKAGQGKEIDTERERCCSSNKALNCENVC